MLIGILGVGGLGKSTLTARVYEDSTGFAHKFWANVSQQANVAELVRRILRQWGQPEDQIKAIPEAELSNALVRWMQRHPCLLVIDNLESLLNRDGCWRSPFDQQFFQQWLTDGETSTLLVTSREQPALTGYKVRWFPLETGLSVNEGAALLKQLGIRGDDAQLQVVVQTVSGFPLSLTLIAGQLLTEEPQNPHVQQLEYYSDLFKIQGLHRGEGQVSVEAVLDWSFARLDPKLQNLLLNVSVYRGTFNISAAQAQMPNDAISEPEVRQLVKRSLLQELDTRDDKGERQFQFQPIVQEYLKRKAGDQTEAHQRAIQYHLSNFTPKPWKNIDDLTAHQGVFYHWCELEQYNQAYNTLRYFDNFLDLQGNYSQLAENYGQLTQQWHPTSETDLINLGWSLGRLGNAYQSLGKFQPAIAAYQEMQSIFNSLQHQQGTSHALGGLGLMYDFLGQSQEAITYHQQALNIVRDVDDIQWKAACLGNLGNSHYFLGQYPQSIRFLQQALEVFRQTGDRQAEARSLGNLGNIHQSLGQYPQAIASLQQTLEISQQLGDRQAEAKALNNLGLTYFSIGTYPQAIKNYQQAFNIAEEIEDAQLQALCLYNLGISYHALCEYQQAIKHHLLSLGIAQQIDDCRTEAKALVGLGIVYQSQKQYQKAIKHHDQALNIARNIGDVQCEASCLGNLGIAYQSLGQYHKAIDYHQQDLEIAQQIGNRRGEATSLGNLGNAYQSLERYQQALEKHQQHLNIAQQIGDLSGKAASLNNLGKAYESLAQHQQAIGCYQQSLETSQQIGDHRIEVIALFGLGNAHHSLKQHQLAIEYYQQVLVIAQQISDRQSEANAWFNMGLALENLNRLPDSIGAFRNARERYAEIGVTEWLQKSEKNIQRVEIALASEAEQSRLEHRKDIRRVLEWIRSWCSQIWQ